MFNKNWRHIMSNGVVIHILFTQRITHVYNKNWWRINVKRRCYTHTIYTKGITHVMCICFK